MKYGYQLPKVAVICLVACLTIESLFAQAREKCVVQLSDYTFFEGRNEPILISLNGEPAKRARLSGPGADLFKIAGNKLSYLPKAGPDTTSYELAISVKHKKSIITDTVKLIRDMFLRNKVIAHRGAWKHTGVPENSIAALKHAVRLGCGGTEFDVRMSLDSVLVINHDPAVQGKDIETTNADDLLRIKISAGETLPTLRAYLEEGMAQTSTKLVLEIKPSSVSKERGILIAQRVFELVRELKAQAWIDYISFDYDICKELIRLDPYARVAYLDGNKSPEELKKDRLWGFDYHYSVLQKSADWISKARKEGLTTNAWTVNDKEIAEWLLKEGIHFITTNEPEMILKLSGH